ncbi:hypothetical protein IFO69_13825 [Echinicola sp. CAU 1574]|uniref:Uncharacterized protein n=1 Tax=Echinicola arenosa TaxID=2774144 RepID=A0ABR9AM48_9BACT|nr:hypothetical protein [Echinicola arenosa]MBD8489832.1 hypothetical protein [Echinicola arenosa]
MKQYHLFYLCLIICFFSACNHNSKPLNLPQELEVIPTNDGTKHICFECDNQVVVYLNAEKLNLHALSGAFGWADTKVKYPDIAFIFYLSGKDKEKIKRELSGYHFPFPVLYDPSGSFYQLNKLDTVSLDNKNLLPFLIKNHQSKGLAQIGMINFFYQQLEELLKEN